MTIINMCFHLAVPPATFSPSTHVLIPSHSQQYHPSGSTRSAAAPPTMQPSQCNLSFIRSQLLHSSQSLEAPAFFNIRLIHINKVSD